MRTSEYIALIDKYGARALEFITYKEKVHHEMIINAVINLDDYGDEFGRALKSSIYGSILANELK